MGARRWDAQGGEWMAGVVGGKGEEGGGDGEGRVEGGGREGKRAGWRESERTGRTENHHNERPRQTPAGDCPTGRTPRPRPIVRRLPLWAIATRAQFIRRRPRLPPTSPPLPPSHVALVPPSSPRSRTSSALMTSPVSPTPSPSRPTSLETAPSCKQPTPVRCLVNPAPFTQTRPGSSDVSHLHEHEQLLLPHLQPIGQSQAQIIPPSPQRRALCFVE